MNPRGGTELQLEQLYKHCDNSILDKFQICTSIPGKVPLDPNKINLLWQKNSYDQGNLQEFFSPDCVFNSQKDFSNVETSGFWIQWHGIKINNPQLKR